MKLNKKGLLVVISGPSGVGKSTVRQALFSMKGHKLSYSVSMTTRPPRVTETNGVDYYFVSQEEFKRRIGEGLFLEHAELVGQFYGTPLDKVEELLDQGREVVLEIETEGALQVRSKMPEAILIFIVPPTKDALYQRLRTRGTEDAYQLEKRILKANKEFKLAHKYDYIVVNDDVHNAADRILAIIRAEHAKTSRSIHSYLDILEEDHA
jgi:guanylate kinase